MTPLPPIGSSLVVCSLAPWTTVRRRIRILVDELVGRDPSLEVLYVAPAVDIPFELLHGRRGALAGPRLERVHPRVHVLRPRKWLPRSLGHFADRSLGRQVDRAATGLGFRDLGDPVVITGPGEFVAVVSATLDAAGPPGVPSRMTDVPTWHQGADALLAVMQRARSRPRGDTMMTRTPPGTVAFLGVTPPYPGSYPHPPKERRR